MPTSQTPPDLGAGWLLGAVHRHIRARWAERIRAYDVTPPQAAALRTLAVEPGLSLRELARQIEAEPINLSRMLEPLEDRGLVCRESRPNDRRAHAIALTPAGVALAASLSAAAAQFEHELATLLDPGFDATVAWLRRALNTLHEPEAANAP